MKGMNLQEQKKCGILVTVIGLVMFAIGFLLGKSPRDGLAERRNNVVFLHALFLTFAKTAAAAARFAR